MRSAISRVDSELIDDLAERMKWVDQIGELKKQHNIAVLQLDRWESLVEDHVARAKQLGLDSDFVKSVFELIHTEAVKRQL